MLFMANVCVQLVSLLGSAPCFESEEEAEKKNIIAGINKKSRRMLRTFRSSLALSHSVIVPQGEFLFPFALNLYAFFARFFCVSG
jgi:hypothetical protein